MPGKWCIQLAFKIRNTSPFLALVVTLFFRLWKSKIRSTMPWVLEDLKVTLKFLTILSIYWKNLHKNFALPTMYSHNQKLLNYHVVQFNEVMKLNKCQILTRLILTHCPRCRRKQKPYKNLKKFWQPCKTSTKRKELKFCNFVHTITL